MAGWHAPRPSGLVRLQRCAACVHMHVQGLWCVVCGVWWALPCRQCALQHTAGGGGQLRASMAATALWTPVLGCVYTAMTATALVLDCMAP